MRRQGKEFQDRGNERRMGAGRGQFDKPRGRGDFARPEGRGNDRPRSFEPRGERPGGRPWGNDDRGASFDRPRTGTYRRDGGAQGGYGRPQERFASRGNDRANGDRFNNDRPRAAPPAPALARAPAASLVSAQQLKAGIGQANRALAEVVEQFGHTLRGDYDIGALEVTVSFDAEGRFLGFGAGGAASMKLSLTPLDAESIVEGDEAEEAEDADDFVHIADDAEEEDEGAEELDDDDDDAGEAEDDEATHERAAAPNGGGQGGEAAHFDA